MVMIMGALLMVITMTVTMMMIMIVTVIDLMCLAQLDSNRVLKVLYIVI